jgi:hypothetical protein
MVLENGEIRCPFGLDMSLVWFSAMGSLDIAEVVKACGLNPATASVQEMDEMDPVLWCLECHGGLQCVTTMTWRQSVGFFFHWIGFCW